MTDMDGIARGDLERLSAFLDGELSPAEAEKLGARLATDKQLSEMLEALRATAEAVRSLPEVSPPHSFALTKKMVRPRRAYPFLQLSTAVAALGFVLVVGADLLLSSSGSSALDVPDQVFFAADQLVPEQELAPGSDPSPAGAPALEGEAADRDLSAATETAADSAAGAEQELAPESDPSPAEAPAAEGEAAEQDLSAAAETATESAAEDGFGQGYLRSDEDARESELGAPPGEELAEEQVREREPAALPGEELVEEGARKADAAQEPSAGESIADRDLTEDEPSLPLSPLRAIEIGLAAAVFVLVGLTLWVRQRG